MQNVIAPQEVHVDSLRTLNSLFNKSRGSLEGIFVLLHFPLSFLSTPLSRRNILSVIVNAAPFGSESISVRVNLYCSRGQIVIFD